MGSNGKHHKRRPQIELVTPASSPEEAAAVVAALEHFIAETTPAPAEEKAENAWQRAALLEGVAAKRALAGPWRG